MCLGLEEVVKCVQESINNKDRNSNSIKNDENVLSYEYPYMCSNCSTDYTTTWRKDKHGNILCEKCLKTLEKKIIKSEHSARLKTAFLKAVKDKEIIEQRLINETLNNSSNILNNFNNNNS
jgi:DNA-directed RNA polymerase subunit RPC12/RpoP